MKSPDVVNIASVPHRSPFRYPGGKTWLVPITRKWLQSLPQPPHLVEPFAGGAIVSLSALFDGMASSITLVELDDDVSAVWRIIRSGRARLLAERILDFKVSSNSVRRVLEQPALTVLDRAFAAIVRNRMQRGGIMARGAGLLKSGENGNGLHSRWYPETLANRLIELARRRNQIQFKQRDGLQVLRQNARDDNAAFFIDPPYTVAGRRLYTHSDLDHAELFRVAATLRGEFLMTYDNAPEIRRLARQYSFKTRAIPMKSTHHAVLTELLISRNLRWLPRARRS